MKKGFFNENNMEYILQNLECFNGKVDAYQYLHGCCDDFALALSDLFGYKIALWLETNLENGNKRLVHAFCIYECQEIDYYVDVRGITKDINDIFAGFNYHGKPSVLIYEKDEAIKKLRNMGISNINDGEPYLIIKEYKDYYAK